MDAEVPGLQHVLAQGEAATATGGEEKITDRHAPISMSQRIEQQNEYLRGWTSYFRLTRHVEMAPAKYAILDETRQSWKDG
ncbi:MAG: group II intron maturase-specific domain-containing protein [Bacillota bacterium]